MASEKIEKALEHLAEILPLHENFSGLDDSSKKIYQAILSSFPNKGRIANLEELEEIDTNAKEIVASLAEKDMVTMDDKGNLSGAYPFTVQERQHKVEINGHTVHAMCALDALAPSAMFDCVTKVSSECDVTKKPVNIELNKQDILNQDEVSDVLFGINWQAANQEISCAESLCTEMLFLKGKDVAEKWQQERAANREVFTLPEAMEFAAAFFVHLVK